VTDRSIGAPVPTNGAPANGTSEPSVAMPGMLLIGFGAAAFVLSVAGFALGWVGCGTWAGIAALLSSAAGLAWLTDEGRRQRGRRPLIPSNRAGTPPTAT
jgi:membrane protein implicated in regulation of membrane protease activity